MGLTYRTYLEGSSTIYGCLKCKTHLSTSDAIISRVNWIYFSYIQPYLIHILAISWTTWSSIFVWICVSILLFLLLFHLIFIVRVNVKYGKAEDRDMTTGLHRVKDIYCIQCSTLLGWTYVCWTTQLVIFCILIPYSIGQGI